MFSQEKARTREHPDTPERADWAVLLCIAATVAAVHMLTNGRYGFHRDELQFLSDARHLDWGYVSYPPLTPFLERIGLGVFGLSMVGLRLFSVIAQAAAIVVTGLMARELGAGRLAQAVAALAVVLSPLPLFNGTEFQYTSFDYLWWVLIAYFTIRLLKSENPRWWLAIGAVVGLGLLTKYSIVFFIAGILGGVVLSSARRYLKSGWFWGGIALALVIFLPNLLWLARHDFISYHFLQHIHKRDVGEGRANGFLADQVLICINVFAAPLALTGLLFYFREQRYRMLGWMYVIPLALFYLARGRGYYMSAAYPMLLAAGAAGAERVLALLRPRSRRIITAAFIAGLAVCGAYVCAVVLPLAASGPLRDFALKRNSDLREEIGWNELVKTVADIRDTLPAEQKAQVGVLVGNYGEQGAIEMLGPSYHLPAPISMTNSAWLRGYPTPPPAMLIVLGFKRADADEAFSGCRLAGHNGNALGIKNEESERHPDIFVCGPPRRPWPVFWRDYQSFG
ncbi:MAG: glycosyltransferase family 39 protein [Acidobacteriota bacterium]|nr:glycosyltransferase family 39 protein [Acidobacteriota bacterium]